MIKLTSLLKTRKKKYWKYNDEGVVKYDAVALLTKRAFVSGYINSIVIWTEAAMHITALKYGKNLACIGKPGFSDILKVFNKMLTNSDIMISQPNMIIITHLF